MTIYEIQFVRDQEAVIYVEAEDVETAKQDAVELLWDADWETLDESLDYANEVRGKVGRYWSGGENGDWVTNA